MSWLNWGYGISQAADAYRGAVDVYNRATTDSVGSLAYRAGKTVAKAAMAYHNLEKWGQEKRARTIHRYYGAPRLTYFDNSFFRHGGKRRKMPYRRGTRVRRRRRFAPRRRAYNRV